MTIFNNFGDERLRPNGLEFMVCAHSTGDAHKIDAPIPATNIIAPHERLLKIGRSLNKIFFDPIGRIHNINKKLLQQKHLVHIYFSSLILAD
ncbi:MAG: hypothetical protein CM15mP126_8260 [Gammaproteobacteria bacterium]|nr:MAG: hypothetical protein CM15mP126_8260 [Gammaproteobacteria bacterium]